MDYMQGELLIYRLKRCREMEKTLLFEWMRELLHQLEQFHRCFGSRGYRYVNPYSVLVTAEDKLFLLDLDAESNEFVLRNMQKRTMRDHFVKPIVHIRENTKLALDLYGYAKTIQFILAHVQVEPSLTSREENRLEKIIDNCLCKNSKKQYADFKQIQKDLPEAQKHPWKIRKKISKKWLLLPAAGVLLLAGTFLYSKKNTESDTLEQPVQEQTGSLKEEVSKHREEENNSIAETEGGIPNPGPTAESAAQGRAEQGKTEQEKTKQEKTKQEKTEQEKTGQEEDPADGLDELTEKVDALQEHVLRNTAHDNQEVIEQGERLKRELYRYLAAAYDREDMQEEALEAYRELCRAEAQEELLEAAYLRRISLEQERSKETAYETGKEALQRIGDSQLLAEKSLELLAEMENITKEACEKELELLSGFYPDLTDLKNYRRLEETYELTEGGKQDEDKNASAGN